SQSRSPARSAAGPLLPLRGRGGQRAPRGDAGGARSLRGRSRAGAARLAEAFVSARWGGRSLERPGPEVGRGLEGAAELEEELLAGPLDGAEAGQVLGVDLAVDETDAPLGQPANEGDEGDLGG